MLARRDWLGSLIGLGVFAFGISLLVGTFKAADTLFQTPSFEALGMSKGQDIDLNVVGPNLTGLIVRCLLLLVMALVGSLVAGKGVSLYSGSLHPKEPREPKPEKAAPAPVVKEERPLVEKETPSPAKVQE